MEKWLYYSYILIILYVISTIVFEYIIKKHSNCTCVTLFTYIFAGLISLFILKNHIGNNCKHYNTIGDIKKTSMTIIILILIISITIILSNKMWINALSSGGNSGYVGSISNIYIVFVTLISAYLFKTNITIQNGAGIGFILLGGYLISK